MPWTSARNLQLRASDFKLDDEPNIHDDYYGDGDGTPSHEERMNELEFRLDQLRGSARSSDSGGFFLIAFGAPLAMILSWSRNASILWCILHGLCSWLYVVYFAVTRQQ